MPLNSQDEAVLSTQSHQLPLLQSPIVSSSPPVTSTLDIDGAPLEDNETHPDSFEVCNSSNIMDAPMKDLPGINFSILAPQSASPLCQRRRTDSSSHLTSDTKIFCHQLNCHRSIGPIDNLQSIIASSTSSAPCLCFIQEPPTNNDYKLTALSKNINIMSAEKASLRPTAALLLSYNLSNFNTLLTEFMTKIISAVRIFTNSSTSDLIVCSFYWDYNIPEVPTSLHKLCAFAST